MRCSCSCQVGEGEVWWRRGTGGCVNQVSLVTKLRPEAGVKPDGKIMLHFEGIQLDSPPLGEESLSSEPMKCARPEKLTWDWNESEVKRSITIEHLGVENWLCGLLLMYNERFSILPSSFCWGKSYNL